MTKGEAKKLLEQGNYFAELPSGKLISASSEDRAKQAAFRAARMFCGEARRNCRMSRALRETNFKVLAYYGEV